MSRGNVFKLSGKQALGNHQYGNPTENSNYDMDQIKNSLKLLKNRKNQRSSAQQDYDYAGNVPAHKNYGAPKNDYNSYDALTKNHLPSSQRDTADYRKKGYKNQYQDQKPYGKQHSQAADPYQYSNKPHNYPAQNNQNRSRNVRQIQPDLYQQAPTYSGKSIGSKISTKNSQYNSYASKPQMPQRRQPQKRQPPQQSYRQQYRNVIQQKSIRQVNSQNKVDIVQYDPRSFKPCRVCGRKFNPDSIQKHESNCKNVFQRKRKQFNAQQHRMVDNQQKKLMKKGQLIQKKLQAQQKNQKIPKWKADSLAFRAVLKQNRGTDIDPRQAAMLQQAQNAAGVKCPYCGRKFNQNAGPRHIAFCQQQQKKNQMKKKK